MRDHFIKSLCELAQGDRRIVLVTGDLGFAVFDEFRSRFPDQFINAGVAEQNMTAMATGMALEGKIVFTYSIGNFSTLRCLEHIRNDACYHNANVKLVCVGGGFSYGALGISHHATEDLAILRSLPDITVVSPCGLWEASEATKAIVAQAGTCYLRLDKSYGDDHPAVGEKFRLGKARILRDGQDLSIIVCGGILEEVQAACRSLEAEGIAVRVISMHTLVPIDSEMILDCCRETGGLLTVEEHTLKGGLGSAVAEVLTDTGVMPRRFSRLGLGGFSSIVGSQKYLRTCYGIDSDAIAARVRELVSMKG